ncbi:ATP-binding protein [Rarobacter faecitabidus]|uniref:AAA domain-containing protein n=1 Tax=Rarobacter faecitabidus TaxID=13243 RepID=A0A542ZAZ0_RARFA|nr:ATP-binding protein [Rarobacter faecitabidus]TQL57476.1 hypothetical protein FB461_2213 [Rarobacter faecitabidus]
MTKTTITTAAFTPPTRKDRRRINQARARAEQQALETTTSSDDTSDVLLDSDLAPRWGKHGPGWGPAAPNLPAHRASAARFAVATPFLADAGLGHRGAPIGRDLLSGGRFYCDPWEWYKGRHITGPSFVSIGQVGTGKSMTNKIMCLGLIALGRKIAVASDPKGEWTALAQQVNSPTVRLGRGSPERINPLDDGIRPAGMTETEWIKRSTSTRRGLLTSILTLLRHGQLMSPQEHTALELALTATLASTRVATLPAVMDHLMNPSPDAAALVGQDGTRLGHALRRLVIGDLAGMFDAESTVRVDPSKPMIVMDTQDLLTEDPTIQAIASTCTNVWLDQVLRGQTGDFWMVITEEGWAAMRDPLMVARMDERVRLAGEWGIANMLIMHELADLDMVGPEGSAHRNQALGLLTKSQVKIIHNQSVTSISLVAKALGLTPEERDMVTKLPQGTALWKVANRSFLVHTEPTSEELAILNTDARRAG